jgi:hypothetical protein
MFILQGPHSPIFLLSLLLANVLFASASTPFPPKGQNSTATPNPTPSFTPSELYALQVRLWENFLSPADVVQAEAINSTLLASDCQGRIDITRTFDGRELNTEYLFGLFANLAANPNQLSLIGVPLSYDIIHFSAQEYISSAATRFMFNLTSVGLVIPVEIDTWISWNGNGEIQQYDATFKYWSWLMDYLITTLAPGLGANSSAQAIQILTGALANSICIAEEQFCVGENQQYASKDACVAFLTQNVRFGQPFEMGQDTIMCRSIHQNMVPYRPAVHW